MLIAQRLNSSSSFWRKISLISKWNSLVFVWKSYLRGLRHTHVLLLVPTRLLNQTLFPQRPIVLTSLFIINLWFDYLVILRVIRSIAHKPRCFWIRFSHHFIKHFWHWLGRLISVPNSKMSILIIDLVEIMMRSSRSQLSGPHRVLVNRLIFVISYHSVQIINWLALVNKLVSASTLEGRF